MTSSAALPWAEMKVLVRRVRVPARARVNRRRAPPVPIRVHRPAAGVPVYLRQGLASPAGGSGPGFMPDPEALQDLHRRSLQQLEPGPTKGPDDADLVSSLEHTSSPRGMPRQTLRNQVASAGEHGSLDLRETYSLDADANPVDLETHGEIGPPQRHPGNPYPVQILFTRDLAYADTRGRLVHAQVRLSLGFERETWDQATRFWVLGGASYGWDRLAGLASDHATASLLVDGVGPDGEGYMSSASAEGSGLSLNALVQALASGGMQGSTLSIAGLARPASPAGAQFQALQAWLDGVDAERYRQAHPPLRWYERGLATAKGLGKAIYNNTVGGVVEGGRQLWDMGRLAVAAGGKLTGWYSYMPRMTSGVGQAAEQGQGTGDILLGMGEGLVMAPVRAVKAFAREDYEAFGEELGNTGFAIDTLGKAPQTARAIGRTGQRVLAGGWRALGQGRGPLLAPEPFPGVRPVAALDAPPYGPVHDAGFADLGDTGVDASASSAVAHAAVPGPHHTSDGTLGPGSSTRVPGTPAAAVSTPSPAGLALRDAAHLSWMQELHRAVTGMGPEPPPWRGEPPQFDAQGTWRGEHPAQAHAAYRQALALGGGMFEAILSRNRATGEYMVMLGKRTSVQAPAHTGAGSWETVAHYHPNPGDALRYTQAAPHDVWTAMLDTLAHGASTHVEFVDSVINGKPTRIAIVVDPQGVRIDVGAGAAGPAGPALGGEVIPVRDLTGGFQRWWSALPGGNPLPLPGQPGGSRWVPSDSQEARSLLIESAEHLKHPDVAAQVRASAPEFGGSPGSAHRSRADLVNHAPAGSVLHALKQLNLGPGRVVRLTHPSDDTVRVDAGAGFQIAQGRLELEVLLKTPGTRLLAAHAANGQPLDPTRAVDGQPYTFMLLTQKGRRWLVPSYLLLKGQR